MTNFKIALNNVVNEMITLNLIECASIAWNDAPETQATVHFLEEDGTSKVHGLMYELYTRLSDKLGHPVSIGHNSPTDGSIQVLGDPSEARMFYVDECCKRDMIFSCQAFLRTRTGYSEQVRSIALAAECLAEALNKSPEYVLETLDWNKDPQAQLIQLLIAYRN